MPKPKVPIPSKKRKIDTKAPWLAYAHKHGPIVGTVLIMLIALWLAVPVDEDAALRARMEEVTQLLISLASSGSEQDRVDVRHLLRQGGVSVNEKDKDGLTALHHAALAGRHLMAKTLLELGADPNVARDGYTPLYAACHGDSDQATEFEGQTGEAAKQRYEEALRSIALMLVKAGADLTADILQAGICAQSRGDVSDSNEFAATLQQASEDALKLMEDDFNKALVAGKKEIESGRVALPRVVAQSALFQRIGRAVLRKGPSQVVTPFLRRAVRDTLAGNAVLELSARTGNTDAMERLLGAGVNPNASPYRRPALMHAILHGRVEVVKQLLAGGAALEVMMDGVRNEAGQSSVQQIPAIFFACLGNPHNQEENKKTEPQRLQIVNLLMDAGAQITEPLRKMKLCAGVDVDTLVREQPQQQGQEQQQE